MANATFVINCIILFESLLIFSGNSFTIFVFWKNRNKLKRTSFLLINLAVADLLVGLSQMIMTGGFYIPDSSQTNITSGEDNLKHLLLSIQHLSFPFTSVFSSYSSHSHLAASPSSSKHQRLYLQRHLCVGCCNSSPDREFVNAVLLLLGN